jgi:hypothetical protein
MIVRTGLLSPHREIKRIVTLFPSQSGQMRTFANHPAIGLLGELAPICWTVIFCDYSWVACFLAAADTVTPTSKPAPQPGRAALPRRRD